MESLNCDYSQNHEENQYTDLIKRILEKGSEESEIPGILKKASCGPCGPTCGCESTFVYSYRAVSQVPSVSSAGATIFFKRAAEGEPAVPSGCSNENQSYQP